MNIQPDLSLIVAVLLVLFIYGLAYNALVSWAERRGYLEGFTWLAVVIGVATTLAGVAVIDWRCAVITLAAFMSSGTPMMAGAVWRYVSARREEQDRERQTATLAK